ncbi:MAG: hypothetical protein ABF904_11655 [Ethanoligenens sp.]
MKLKAIARLCAKSKAISVIDVPGNQGDTVVQWIGNFSAIYPVFDLPRLEKESVLTIFDVKSDKRDDYFFQEIGVPGRMCLDDSSTNEVEIDQGIFGIEIVIHGVTLQPLKTSQGVTFIDTDYLAPLGDYENVELFERISTDDKTIYIVAKVGLVIKAVIQPYSLINQDFANKMWELSRACTHAMEYKQS